MFEHELETICARVDQLDDGDKRLLIAVAGPPAAGKSTLAELLVDKLNTKTNGAAALVPMDGYHLDNAVLDQLNLRSRKGAPETFDAEGFLSLISSIAANEGDVHYPTFDRSNDCTVPNSAKVVADTRLVVVEGNYLLLDAPIWSQLKDHFDLTIFISPSLQVLEERLIQRWLEHGFDQSQAEVKAHGNDIPNARTIVEGSTKADLQFTGG